LKTILEFLQLKQTNTQIFDPAFESDCPEMLGHYTPWTRFQGENDLLHVLGSDRPDFRWFLLGFRGSGTPLHIDPLHSSAWNTLVVGKKKWIIINPMNDPSAAGMDQSEDMNKSSDREEGLGVFETDGSWQWRTSIQTAAKDAAATCVFEFEQHEGDTVVVPAGHLHAVVNLEDSVAITHNFVTADIASFSLQALAKVAPEKAAKWMRRLEFHYPGIAANILSGQPL
jgi:histone arginine demethylase JMJD6